MDQGDFLLIDLRAVWSAVGRLPVRNHRKENNFFALLVWSSFCFAGSFFYAYAYCSRKARKERMKIYTGILQYNHFEYFGNYTYFYVKEQPFQ